MCCCKPPVRPHAWFRDGSLSWPGQEHRTDCESVCVDESVAGSQTIAAFPGRGAPVKRDVGEKTPGFHGQRSRIAFFHYF